MDSKVCLVIQSNIALSIAFILLLMPIAIYIVEEVKLVKELKQWAKVVEDVIRVELF